VICVAFEAVCDLLQPKLLADMIDSGVMRMNMDYVVKIGLLMLLVTALGAGFASARNYLSSKASQSFGARMRRDLFVKIQRLSVSDAEIYDAGSLVTRMTNDVTQLTNFINGLMRIFVKAPITCVGGIILASSLNIRMLPIALSVVIAAGISITLSMLLSYPVFSRVQKAIDRLNTTVREYLIGIRLVKAFGKYDYERDRFKISNDRLSHETARAGRLLGIFSPVNNLAANLGIVAILFFGARWVSGGDMTVGQIMAFVSYMTQILVSLSMISNILNVFVRTKASYIRIAEIMAMKDSEFPAADLDGTVFPESDILTEFTNVSFSYPLSSGEKALKNISFSVKKGETIGVIGPTGSGKSTLASLLLKFYELYEGSISFHGLDISDIEPWRLRARAAIVPQTPMLFTGTIRENILWGNPSLSDGEALDFARLALADEFIDSSPGGLETVLGQGGINLSGGQKQRLSIARALAAKPDLLILDDCTSALDALTEAKVLDGLREASAGMSCILISQRVSSVMRADKILVMENGSLAGFGGHDELLDACSVYRDIYMSQMGRGAKLNG
jgi:ATP-binding cassette subfamily B protein